MNGFENEITQLRVRIHALEEQKAEVAKFRDLHWAFLAPIWKLPPEILGELCIRCLSSSVPGLQTMEAHCPWYPGLVDGLSSRSWD